MQVFNDSFSIGTRRRCEMVDITGHVAKLARQSNIENGDVIVYCPHTTAGITINENADPSVCHDILLTLDELLPQHRKGYRHMEGNSDAHVKSSLIGPSQQIIIQDGKLVLGTWQAIFLCEFDGPRTRNVIVQVRSA